MHTNPAHRVQHRHTWLNSLFEQTYNGLMTVRQKRTNADYSTHFRRWGSPEDFGMTFLNTARLGLHPEEL